MMKSKSNPFLIYIIRKMQATRRMKVQWQILNPFIIETKGLLCNILHKNVRSQEGKQTAPWIKITIGFLIPYFFIFHCFSSDVELVAINSNRIYLSIICNLQFLIKGRMIQMNKFFCTFWLQLFYLHINANTKLWITECSKCKNLF